MSGGYRVEVPGQAVIFEVERLRRDRHELIGELTVRCDLPGALSVNGALSTGDFNFSSIRARQDRAKFLALRARTNGDVDWLALLEDLCQKVFLSEREGDPAIELRRIPKPPPSDDLYVDGLAFPRRHPTILFGDGGSAKSYTALYIAGFLAMKGLMTVLFDWELSGEDHRERLERIFGATMPGVLYCRCERPLHQEVDRLARVVRDHKIQYSIFDSIAPACDGRPEDAETAARYFRATREISGGSLHIAHVNRSEENDRKPFGSSFWHNLARATWFVQATEPSVDGSEFKLGFFNRKSNLGPLRAPLSWQITFTETQTKFLRANIAENPELAVKLTVRQRMAHLLKHGSMTPEEIAAEIEADVETINRTARRYRTNFIVLSGGRIGLTERVV